MLPKVVVVALPSLSKTCVLCGHSENNGIIWCPNCHKLQPFPNSSPSYFELFGFPPQLEISLDELRNIFYFLSQKTHPDTHSQQGTLEQINAGRWSTLINKAYQTLRDPSARTEYLLELFQVSKMKLQSIPTDLAEAYFDLQETLSEGPNPDALNSFLRRLEQEESELKKNWADLNDSWNKLGPNPGLLQRLKTHFDSSKYLSSLQNELNKWSAK